MNQIENKREEVVVKSEEKKIWAWVDTLARF